MLSKKVFITFFLYLQQEETREILMISKNRRQFQLFCCEKTPLFSSCGRRKMSEKFINYVKFSFYASSQAIFFSSDRKEPRILLCLDRRISGFQKIFFTIANCAFIHVAIDEFKKKYHFDHLFTSQIYQIIDSI